MAFFEAKNAIKNKGFGETELIEYNTFQLQQRSQLNIKSIIYCLSVLIAYHFVEK